MGDKVLTKDEWKHANFVEAMRRLPTPIPAYDNGAPCPWCGHLHDRITFGHNSCESCSRPFAFGSPPWPTEPKERLVCWVNFPWAEWEAVGEKASALEDWKPNERVKAHWKYWTDYMKDEAMDKAATHHFDSTIN